MQFRGGVHLVDTDEASGGDSEKLASAIIESEVISTLEGRRTGRVLELHRHLGVRALESCALILRRRVHMQISSWARVNANLAT